MVGPELQGTPGKQHKAGQKIRQRAVDRYETARRGGHRDALHTAAPSAKYPYRPDHTNEKASGADPSNED
jgi:hypothetical protein